ncbi:MAG: hypothetical protein GY870_07630 [archaeon]|nr:hypothetical protein [archaeon]
MNNEKFENLLKSAVFLLVIIGISHLIESLILTASIITSIEINDIIQLIQGFLGSDYLTLTVTAFIYSLFILFFVNKLLRLVLNQKLDNTKAAIIICTVVPFLNLMTSSIQLVMDVDLLVQMPILYGFIVFHIIADIYIFIVLFFNKTILDNMDNDEKVGYFGIVLIRGNGMNHLFHLLGLILEFSVTTLLYSLVFGSANVILGQLLYKKKEDKKIQILGIIIPIIATICAILLVIVESNSYFFSNRILYTIVYALIIPSRIYYTKKKS